MSGVSDSQITNLFTADYYEPFEMNVLNLYNEYYIDGNISSNIVVNLVKIGGRETARFSASYFDNEANRRILQDTTTSAQNITVSTWCSFEDLCDGLRSVSTNKGCFLDFWFHKFSMSFFKVQ